jgi:hypothetical protein
MNCQFHFSWWSFKALFPKYGLHLANFVAGRSEYFIPLIMIATGLFGIYELLIIG